MKRRMYMSASLEMNASELTPDEKFILAKSIGYLQRHLQRFPLFDSATLTFASWIFAERVDDLLDFFLNGKIRSTFKVHYDAFMEGAKDTEDYGEILHKGYRSASHAERKRFKGYLIRLLEKRLSVTRHRGSAPCTKVIRSLQQMFEMTEVDTEICAFLFVNKTYDATESFFDYHLDCFKFRGRKFIANMIGARESEIHESVMKLTRYGILDMVSQEFSLNDDFLTYLQRPSPHNLTSEFYARAPSSPLPIEAHFISAEKIDHVMRLLKARTDTPSHLLFYGPPGTGKTSLARRLGTALGLSTFEIAKNENNLSSARRAAITACINMTQSGSGGLIIVDEADNLLNTSAPWLMLGETHDKGWINQLLEMPGQRMIWITNSVRQMDAAVMRRFSFSIDFQPLSRRQRKRLWETVLRQNRVKRHFEATQIAEMASTYEVSAGVVDTAVKKAIDTGARTRDGFQAAVALGIDAYCTLKDRGRKRLKERPFGRQFTLDGLNLNADMNVILSQADRFGRMLTSAAEECPHQMSLLFYGPPGAGKSELARYVGHRIDRPVVFKRYSDLQSMFVGEGEKNVREAFDNAQRDRAVLVIDEMDSLLLTRDRARHSWESTFTSEVLTAIERFQSLLICTTNRIEDLDAAAMRRFTHKIEFDFLTGKGNLIFYERLLGPLTDAPLGAKEREIITLIKDLTPGDFRTVANRHGFYPRETLAHALLIDALKAEVRIKDINAGNKAIGF